MGNLVTQQHIVQVSTPNAFETYCSWAVNCTCPSHQQNPKAEMWKRKASGGSNTYSNASTQHFGQPIQVMHKLQKLILTFGGHKLSRMVLSSSYGKMCTARGTWDVLLPKTIWQSEWIWNDFRSITKKGVLIANGWCMQALSCCVLSPKVSLVLTCA